MARSRKETWNSSMADSKYILNCRTNLHGSPRMSEGLVFSYWPRVKAWINPSNVRGYPQFIGGLVEEVNGM